MHYEVKKINKDTPQNVFSSKLTCILRCEHQRQQMPPFQMNAEIGKDVSVERPPSCQFCSQLHSRATKKFSERETYMSLSADLKL